MRESGSVLCHPVRADRGARGGVRTPCRRGGLSVGATAAFPAMLLLLAVDISVCIEILQNAHVNGAVARSK